VPITMRHQERRTEAQPGSRQRAHQGSCEAVGEPIDSYSGHARDAPPGVNSSCPGPRAGVRIRPGWPRLAGETNLRPREHALTLAARLTVSCAWGPRTGRGGPGPEWPARRPGGEEDCR